MGESEILKSLNYSCILYNKVSPMNTALNVCEVENLQGVKGRMVIRKGKKTR